MILTKRGEDPKKGAMYTADNMSRLLGNEATNEDAERFAAYLIAQGWELLENEDGQIEAWRNDNTMTEQEWQEALADCFRTHEISLDNGANYMTAAEAMPIIESSGLWDAVVSVMNTEARERVHAELAPCTELDFLRRYLELAPSDLIIG